MSEAVFRVGAIVTPLFEKNPRPGSACPVKANMCVEGRSQKIILVEKGGKMPEPGQRYTTEIVRITGVPGKRSGIIWVRLIEQIIDLHIPGVWIDPQTLAAMLVVLKDPKGNLMMEGPQGTGKSTVARALAGLIGATYLKVSGGMIKKAAALLGRVNAGTVKNRLNFIWEDSEFTAALRTAAMNPDIKYLVHVDEWHRMDPEPRDMTLDVLEGQERSLQLANGDRIVVGPNVHFVASGNVGSGFTVQRQDTAARDRWVTFVIPYMPHDAELEHCMRLYPSCDKASMDTALKVINSMRSEGIKENGAINLTALPSVRRSERLAMFLAERSTDGKNKFELPYLFELVVTNQYDGPIHKKSSDAYKVNAFITQQLTELKVIAA